MPPIQWLKLRQNKLPFVRPSTSDTTVAPVVVNPEIISKSASAKCGISPLITNGRHPITDIRIHESATVTKPSRR